MGTKPSKNTQESATKDGRRVGAHSGIPEDPVPYTGSPLEFTFVNIEASLKYESTSSSAPMFTTNIDAYYGLISQPYAQGFVMNQFQVIPGVHTQKGFNSSRGMPFQSILSRPVNGPPSHEQWQLRVEKSFLQTQIVMEFSTTQSGIVSDTSDFYQKIHSVAAQGGRLICVEITGFEKGPNYQQSLVGHRGVKGVDLFFNMPLHPNPQIYFYQAISVPVQFRVKAAFPENRIEVLTDFKGQFNAFLQKGWKLVEINLDCGVTARAANLETQVSQNSIWFFEKEASKMNSEVPEWEGTIVEYDHKVSSAMSGMKAKTIWDPVVTEMGQRGWELACLLESPDVSPTGFNVVTMKILMFFQRRIMPTQADRAIPTPAEYSPPPQGSSPSTQGE